MIYRILIIASVFLLRALPSYGANPTTVNIALSQALVPVGFDDNDRVQFAVMGTFANTCFRVGPNALEVDPIKKTIHVQQQAYYYSQATCLEMTVPFSQIINVGILGSGNYTIEDYVTKKPIGAMAVTIALNSGPDDFLYAPITDAYVVSDKQAKKNTLVLNGSFSDRCSEFQEVKVTYGENTIVAQPIIKRIAGFRCAETKTRFLKTVELKEDLQGTYLLHVRSLNGQAVNRIIDVE